MQSGVVHRIIASQIRDEQSVAAVHVRPGSHTGHRDPPQSTSLSPWFCTMSEHVAIVHVPMSQMRLAQSSFTVHTPPASHPGQIVPPQSMSVSSAFIIMSSHDVDVHVPLSHTWL
jgi:hypothetical protein